VYEHPISALNVVPTACATANAKQPDGVEGVNHQPYHKGEKADAPHEKLAWRFGP
jgi:hypothetical protein